MLAARVTTILIFLLTICSAQTDESTAEGCHNQAHLEFYLQPKDLDREKIHITSIPEKIACPNANSTTSSCTEEVSKVSS